VQLLLHVEDTPHRIALAFGIGVYIAFFPIFGIHTGMALIIAFLFKLSRVAMLLGIWVNNPWTIAPMYMGGTLLGCVLLGVSRSDLPEIDWALEGHAFYEELMIVLRPYLWPFVVGNTVAGILAGLLAYFALRFFLERRRVPPRPETVREA
jgi:uncharacterized protein (DUF2062 family)